MRTETLADGQDVLAGFLGARACGRAQGATTYLAERAGMPYLLVVAAPEIGGTVTVIAFEDEAERARHLAGHDREPAPAGPSPARV
ncbi:hypothetical protein SAMN04489712_113110 [Thermomonospora echinospora]|uniref:Uncharacterized protein n=1 Tax=Thermomonospora echinospora TaxID=1992 RepID=A0A1H6D5E2_9ACTN|nr:hypothetical protein [Thermomonospora echinospora]SEG80599.1 hypothetical protein SAMN04489712_113110 [Thermomonospora echinospora]